MTESRDTNTGDVCIRDLHFRVFRLLPGFRSMRPDFPLFFPPGGGGGGLGTAPAEAPNCASRAPAGSPEGPERAPRTPIGPAEATQEAKQDHGLDQEKVLEASRAFGSAQHRPPNVPNGALSWRQSQGHPVNNVWASMDVFFSRSQQARAHPIGLQ